MVIDGTEPVDDVPARDAGIAALYHQEYVSLVSRGHLLTGSNEAAEDVVQESFVRMYRSWDRADRPAAYLRTIVVNGCRTWRRRRRLERERLPRPVPEGVDPEARELLDALARLGIRQRTALVLRFYADMCEADIAKPRSTDELISGEAAYPRERPPELGR